MKRSVSRRGFVVGAGTVALSAALGLAACAKEEPAPKPAPADPSAPEEPAPASKPAGDAVRIGSMPTEDILPLWVAQQEGLFDKHGVKVEIVLFDSAQNLSAAITAREVEMAMTDPMRTVKLAESGVGLTMGWITLGADASQGRFGVLISPMSGFHSLADLVGCTQGVGVASNTVPEYVFDKLCEQAGVDSASIKVSEVPSLPDRYSLLSAGQLDAAALPGSMLAFGEKNGLMVLADDTKGDNLSQSVMAVLTDWDTDDATMRIADAWDEAADLINADPEKYRGLLIEHANLNDTVADSYPISTYPHAVADDGNLAHPSLDLIQPQLDWMAKKGYAGDDVFYDDADGTLSFG